MTNLFTGEQKTGDKETTGRTTPRLQPPKRDQTQPAMAAARGNRFGFRQNAVRPTTGIAPKYNEYDNVNNNNTTSDNDKPRSKSASAPTRFNVNAGQQQSSMKTVSEASRSHTNAMYDDTLIDVSVRLLKLSN